MPHTPVVYAIAPNAFVAERDVDSPAVGVIGVARWPGLPGQPVWATAAGDNRPCARCGRAGSWPDAPVGGILRDDAPADPSIRLCCGCAARSIAGRAAADPVYTAVSWRALNIGWEADLPGEADGQPERCVDCAAPHSTDSPAGELRAYDARMNPAPPDDPRYPYAGKSVCLPCACDRAAAATHALSTPAAA